MLSVKFADGGGSVWMISLLFGWVIKLHFPLRPKGCTSGALFFNMIFWYTRRPRPKSTLVASLMSW